MSAGGVAAVPPQDGVTLERDVIIVMPVYEDLVAFRQLLRACRDELGDAACVVAVDDGSVAQPVQASDLDEAGMPGVVLRLRRNVGHQRAIAVGLAHVAARIRPSQRVVVMDSDGEDRPASILPLLRMLDDEAADVAVAERATRFESRFFKVGYRVYRGVFRALTGRVIRFGNFIALKAHAARRLAAMHEAGIHVAAAVLASRLRLVALPIDRGTRYAGRSHMRVVSLVLHGFKAVMVFAEDVLVRVGIACTLIASLAVLAALATVVLKLVGFATPGWFSVAFGILVLMFLQTGALALMSLMLTGVMRSGTVTGAIDHHAFIEAVLPATGRGSP